MDFLARLIGSTLPPKKPAARPAANDPQARLNRFKRVYGNILELCNRPRNLAIEGPLLYDLHISLDRLAAQLRDETRAPVPHKCLQFARSNQVYTVVARAATVSHYEPVIRSGIGVFAALVDSEEEDFLASDHFAKSLMRLVRKVLESGNILVDTETETAILELLFTIAAKIRLQPDILPVWFQSTARPELEDVFLKEKKSFVGITQKDDFPLCYLLIDRVHHEGRIGDFARTGLLYVFEATGRSAALENWVVSSDLPTLMASGLGALYSQLDRELSILHPDATLPAVLALSDYTTTHTRATAESAFSERHKAHMVTFLSYLAFWQDVLDHCRSSDVRQTLLDHLQILFLQQLLYPSLLQSSDTDAGSSVAVLTYMTAMLESLEYPDLIHMMLTYLLAIEEGQKVVSVPVGQSTPGKPSNPPRSPTSVKRRQSLMLLSAAKDPEDMVDPNLFNLIDLISNNIISRNSQSVFAALKLASTVLCRQKAYAFGTLLKVQKTRPGPTARTIGALETELQEYADLALSLHPQSNLDVTYSRLCEDSRLGIEAQSYLNLSAQERKNDQMNPIIGTYLLVEEHVLIRNMRALLQTFWTNSIDVNLALTQTLISIAQCVEIRLDNWLALSPSTYRFEDDTSGPTRPWQTHADSQEQSAWAAISEANRHPSFSDDEAPMLLRELMAIAAQLDTVRARVPNLDQLITARKNLLQGTHLDPASMEPSGLTSSGLTQQNAYLDVRQAFRGHSRNTSLSSTTRGRTGNKKATNNQSAPASATASRTASRPRSKQDKEGNLSPSPTRQSLFKPPPPEMPSTTDVLMQSFSFPEKEAVVPAEDLSSESDGAHVTEEAATNDDGSRRTASLNHILTNTVVLQEFVLEIVAVLQVRAAVLGEKEVRLV